VNNPKQAYPDGHFYSPIPSFTDIERRANEYVYDGIDFNESEQLELMFALSKYYPEFSNWLRYDPDNVYYYDSDAVCLYGMMRHFNPSKIIEIDSGHSSALMLDTSELFLHNVEFNFIDPNTERLDSILTEEDKVKHLVIKSKVQDVDLEIFDSLQANDILFVDSSHVSKTGSDVNFVLFEILPRLADGVLIHFHDIFYLFDYPQDWVLGGRSWNEMFALRAFLQYNNSFKMILFNTYLHDTQNQWLTANMPICLTKRDKAFMHSGSLWMQKSTGLLEDNSL